MIKHFTATVFIIHENKVLLIKHRKLNKWLPPGGHIDSNETPPEAAIREAKEETGLNIELISDENVWFENTNVKSFERPYHCMTACVPSFADQPAHFHMDLTYIGKVVDGTLERNHQETLGIRWFTIDEISSLKVGEEVFSETIEVIKKILYKNI